MYAALEQLLEDILSEYASGDNYQRLMAAKERYIKLTGLLNEEDDDFDARMNCFSDWFIFNHELPSGERVYQKYINQKKLPNEQRKLLDSVRFSLFEVVKISSKKKLIIRDLISDKKLELANAYNELGLVEDDLFLSHTVEIESQMYLLKGLRSLPNSLRSLLKKECKKVSKQNNLREQEAFLLKLEYYRSKMNNYSHLDPSKIFIFE
jgi:hypothetical protein